MSASQTVNVITAGATLTPGPLYNRIRKYVCVNSTGWVLQYCSGSECNSLCVDCTCRLVCCGTGNTSSITVTSKQVPVLLLLKAGNTCGFSPATSLTVTATPVGQWIGITSNWNDGQNWCSGIPPDGTIDVTIPGCCTPNDPVVSTAIAMTHNITIASGASLTVTGNTLQIAGSITNNGTFDATNGTIELNGAAPQTIPAGTFMNNQVKDMVISNTNATGVTLGGPLDIYRSLTYSAAGTRLVSNGNLTLKSSATETAWLGKLTASQVLSGNVTVERFIATGAHTKTWQLLGIPTGPLTGGQTVNDAWQEGATVPNQNLNPGFGTQITSDISPLPFRFDASTPAGPSMKVYNSGTGGYDGIPSTVIPIYNQKGYFVFVRGDRGVTAFNQAATQTRLETTGPLFTPANPPPSTLIPATSLDL